MIPQRRRGRYGACVPSLTADRSFHVLVAAGGKLYEYWPVTAPDAWQAIRQVMEELEVRPIGTSSHILVKPG